MSDEIYKAPIEIFEHLDIKISDYMIESFGDELKIYRLLTPEEIDDFPDGKVMVSGNGDFMIFVTTCESKKDAEAIIHSYWEAVRKPYTM
ncbi:hypothetical protein [Paenibacillus sp. FSL L8-0709]|uniref:hypothetical protein n=1 Tax=Paenibacillus sp. FSL L8-0709 TaxID=2975312 RepID=UPI0030FB187B